MNSKLICCTPNSRGMGTNKNSRLKPEFERFSKRVTTQAKLCVPAREVNLPRFVGGTNWNNDRKYTY